jgi:hypothetical protein
MAKDVDDWRRWVERRESTQHTGPEDSPFELSQEGMISVFRGIDCLIIFRTVTTLREIQQ